MSTWRRSVEFLICCFIVLLPQDGTAQRKIGCLFSERLCQSDRMEWCYNDMAFGQCLPEDGVIEDDTTTTGGDIAYFKFELSENDLHDVSKELRRLFTLGYRWGHAYTQCRLMRMLSAIQRSDLFDLDSCGEFADNDLEGALNAMERVTAVKNVNPLNEAVIRYSPPRDDANFAEEIFYPPIDIDRQRQSEELRQLLLGPSVINDRNDNDVINYDVSQMTDPYHQVVDSATKRKKNEDYYYVEKEEDPSPSVERNGKFRFYTEGGVLVAQDDQEEPKNDMTLTLLTGGRSKQQFKRPERLDVKKPGPIPLQGEKSREFDTVDSSDVQKMTVGMMEKKDARNPSPQTAQMKMMRTDDAQQQQQQQQYVFVEFQENSETFFKNWQHGGEQFMRTVARLLRMEYAHDFSDTMIHYRAVTFRVNPTNGRGYSAVEVAKAIEQLSDVIRQMTGAEIQSVGVASRAQLQQRLYDDENTRQKMTAIDTYNDNQLIVIALVCGILMALIVATVILALVRRHLKTKKKHDDLDEMAKAPFKNAVTKDYQDLCRSRMATVMKPSNEKNQQGGRHFDSLSSRSSTSSWSEEPSMNNMDISTGHMVLTYMEDHLKNQDRLNQEWEGLCAYGAEPADTAMALLPENAAKNRNCDVVPYAHARVMLNALTNVTGEDYVNASSITDHDPRNPAYIATQGPLPHTTCDFWQLIWEQGAVVIVMLTRLTEGGVAMCHRYWPEEGSELCHIYEIHLVSEHIWCDDYLVRSFYLKNVRTGETRTVTQFHFLSWPHDGVPSSTKALLEFRRKVNKSYRGRSCPIVVHCSDGGGRTGTYCLIDMVLSRMSKGAKEIDIAATLEHLRDQRGKMVATKQQFEFVLTAVAEEVHAILKALPPPPVAPSTTTTTTTTTTQIINEIK